MEIRINLATASQKDAEHAIFIIGAYFGLTQSTVKDLRVLFPAQDVTTGPAHPPAPQVVALDPAAPPAPQAAALDPAATFGALPAALPPGAGEQPDNSDPAAVFAGNVAGAAAGPATAALPGTPALSAPTVAAPVGSLPAPPPAPVASAPSGVVVDATGLPWDQRIHASGEGGAKPQTADGKWRKRRGVQPLEVSRVEGELRATMAAGGRTPAQNVAALAAMPAAGTGLPVPPAPPVAATPAGAQPQAAPTTFEQLMPRVTAAVMAGTLPQGALLQAVTAYSLPTIPALAQRPDLVPTIWAYLTSLYPAIA